MPLRLNDGQHYRLMNVESKDATNSSQPGDKDISLEIDRDRDGLFNGSEDLRITDQNQIELLLDDKKDNVELAVEYPFIDEVEEHILNARVISELLLEAKDFATKAKALAFWNSDKVVYGRKGISLTKQAFEKDPSHRIARFSFAMTVASIKDSFWKEQAEESMQLNVDTEASKLMKILAEDKYDILGQLMLQRLYDLYEQKQELKSLKHWINQLQNERSEEYKEALGIYNKALKH